MESIDEHNNRVMTIIAAARDHPPDERQEYLRLACQGDDELLREVSDYLEWESRMGDFLLPAARTEDMQRLQSPAVALEAIRVYRLLQKLGEGGTAEVWLAEQSTPLYRRVALKLISRAWTPSDDRAL